MDYQDESARGEQSGSESHEASPATPAREAPRRRPTPFPKSERGVSQADGEA